jgi:acyl-CoA thioester hydrolase
MTHHTSTYRVYYEDTDAGGIMYHGNFVNFCERSRTEWINANGISNTELRERGVGIVVRHLEAEYYAPAVLEDIVNVTTEILEVKNSSFILKHTMMREETVLFDMKVVLVCITPEGRPMRIPDFFKNILS